VLYIATATAEDDEMRTRIAAHRASRPPHWRTAEAPDDPAAVLAAHDLPYSVAMLDCLTLLVSNVLLGGLHVDFDPARFDADDAECRVHRALEDLLSAYSAGTRSLVIVSNEVGMGLVPPYPLGRIYRDVLGRVNARVAAAADVVILMVAGLPVELKRLADAWDAKAARLFDPPE
jgi:adenosylcobinamide kinase/adenosylcobinamide-phosphate guanylyltransferase